MGARASTRQIKTGVLMADLSWQIIATVSALSIHMVGLSIILWKVSRWVTQRDEAIKTTLIGTKENSEDIKALTKSLSRYARETSQGIAKLEQMALQREKGQDHIEGQVDACRRSVMELTAELSKVIGNLDALWITLQNLFPDQIPKRASDRV